MDDFFVIVNPVAGNGKPSRVQQRLMPALNRLGKYTFADTQSAGHASRLAREAAEAGYTRILVVGGDGTLNETVNGLMAARVPVGSICLGVLPTGSGNDWRKSLGYPSDPLKVLQKLPHAQPIFHDVGLLTFTENGYTHSRYFLNVAGFGFGGLVVAKAMHIKRHFTYPRLAYLAALVQSLGAYSAIPVSIEADHERFEAVAFNLSIGNGRYFGGGMHILPHALPNDGLLAFSMVREIGKMRVIANIGKLFSGSYVRLPEVRVLKAKTVRIQSEALMRCEVEGELLGQATAFELSLLPKALKVWDMRT